MTERSKPIEYWCKAWVFSTKLWDFNTNMKSWKPNFGVSKFHFVRKLSALACLLGCCVKSSQHSIEPKLTESFHRHGECPEIIPIYSLVIIAKFQLDNRMAKIICIYKRLYAMCNAYTQRENERERELNTKRQSHWVWEMLYININITCTRT